MKQASHTLAGWGTRCFKVAILAVAALAFAATDIASAQTWCTVLEEAPDAAMVTDATVRERIVASGFPWHVRDNSSGIEMLLIPGGTFNMGCSASNSYGCNGDETNHQVTLSKAFYLGKTEVTQAQWEAKMGNNPSAFRGNANNPVETVSWNEIAGFNTATGLRLPNEAEWEYACRGGTTTAFHSMPGYPNGTYNDSLLGNIAWYGSNNSPSGTKPVAGKAANAFGMYDMSGNVWEWCNDWYGSYAAGNATDPAGPSSGSSRVLRGGVWFDNSNYCRSSFRTSDVPDNRGNYAGFRTARTPAASDFADTDADGVPDYRDNCVNIANPSQADCDNDGIGDACELAVVNGSPYPGAVQWTVASGGNGHWYWVSAETMPWASANAFAQSNNGHLATIASAQENSHVRSRIAVGTWIGGFQAPNTCEPGCAWEWVTGELWSYTNWNAGEPNNAYLGQGQIFAQDSLYMYQTSGNWDDNTDTAAAPFIVEWESGLTTESDCNNNTIPDSCEIANGGDCNNNGQLDACEIANHTATDCNNNGIPDTCDIANNTDGDCDGDGIPNSCEIILGALDANLNGIPDGCEGDCNVNGQLDYLDIAAGAADCNGNLMIDSCEDGSGIYRNSGNLGNIGSGVPRSVTFDTLPAAVTSVTLQVSARANLYASNRFLIMNLNGVLIKYPFMTNGTDCPSTANTYSLTFTASEFNTLTASGSLDVAFTAPGTVNATLCGSDALLQVRLAYEQTFTDCDNDGLRDFCAIASGAVKDCNRNGIPDSCDIATGFAKDCNGNGIPDSCDIATGLAPDCNSNGIPDNCDPDTDGDGIIDACDPCPNVAGPCNGCPLNVCGDCGTAADTDGDGTANCIDNDDDNDGVVDSMDAFPLDASESVDTDGDGQGDNADQDDDGDGTDDATDGCPLDATKSAPGQCGCGVPDIDTDGDGVADCLDNCPAVANPSQTDCDGNGIGEACETFTDCNANGIPDSCDLASGFAKDCNGNGKPDSCDLAATGSPYPGAVQWTVASGGNGHWYAVVPLPKTNWVPSRQKAISMGADLACCGTTNEWLFIASILESIQHNNPSQCWLGGTGSSNSQWTWIDGTTFNNPKWISCAPNNGQPAGIITSRECSSPSYGWDDSTDSSWEIVYIYGFIAEWSTGLPTESDCNANTIPDSCEIANGGDCNNNGLLDACETFDQTTPDCNNNSVPDTCDIESGTARDCNLNNVPDSCDIAAGALDENSDGRIDLCNYALGDFDLDNVVNSADLGFCLIFYGEIDPPFGDLNGNGICDAADLGQLLGNYGILP